MIVHEPVIFNQVKCLAKFSTMLGISAYCNQRMHHLTYYTECTFCLLHSVKKRSSIFFYLSLFKHEYTIILYQRVSYACVYLYSVMTHLHIGFDDVVCYEIMKHANRVNSIAVFLFKMNVTYLQCVYISSRYGVMNV